MIVEKRKNFIINIFYFAIIIALIYIAVKYVLGLLLPFLFGFIIAAALRPAIRFISGKLHLHKKVTAVVVVLLSYSIVGFVLSLLGIRLFSAAKRLVMKLPQIYSSSIEPAITQLFGNIEELLASMAPETVQTIQDAAKSLSTSLGSTVSNVSSAIIQGISSAISSVPGLLIIVLLSILSSVFFSIDYDKISGYIMKSFSVQGNKLVMEIKNFLLHLGTKYVKGYALLMSVTFVELSVGLSILRVDGAILIAALISVIDILPVLGTGGVVIPWILIEIINGRPSFAIGLTVLYGIILIVRNILEPKIIGEQIGLHPLAMLLCMYVGTRLFGFIGIFALPIIVVVAKHLYDKDMLHFEG